MSAYCINLESVETTLKRRSSVLRVAEKCKQRTWERSRDHSAPSISVFHSMKAAKCPNYISITAINYNYSIKNRKVDVCETFAGGIDIFRARKKNPREDKYFLRRTIFPYQFRSVETTHCVFRDRARKTPKFERERFARKYGDSNHWTEFRIKISMCYVSKSTHGSYANLIQTCLRRKNIIIINATYVYEFVNEVVCRVWEK